METDMDLIVAILAVISVIVLFTLWRQTALNHEINKLKADVRSHATYAATPAAIA